MAKPLTNPLLTPEVETALRGLSKDALIDALADLLVLVTADSVDDPPELSEVAELLNPRLRIRGDRLLRVSSPDLETALRGLSKNALIDCLGDVLGLVTGNLDDPPELSEVAELLNPSLRLRGDRLLQVPSPELKVVAEPFAGLETCIPDTDYDPHRQDRYPAEGRSWEPCFLCDRPVVNDRPHTRVETLGGCQVVAQDTRPADLEEHPDYSGTYAVGPRCAKRLGARWKLRVS